MTAPVCFACQVRMVCAKTGVAVELMASAEPYQIFNADLFECPACGFKVVSSFGKTPIAEHFQRERYAEFLKGVALRFWSTLAEKAEFTSARRRERSEPEPQLACTSMVCHLAGVHLPSCPQYKAPNA
jgi:hypothetical protein